MGKLKGNLGPVTEPHYLMSDTIFRGERLINSGTQSSSRNLGKPHHLFPSLRPANGPREKKTTGARLARVAETVPRAGRRWRRSRSPRRVPGRARGAGRAGCARCLGFCLPAQSRAEPGPWPEGFSPRRWTGRSPLPARPADSPALPAASPSSRPAFLQELTAWHPRAGGGARRPQASAALPGWPPAEAGSFPSFSAR